MVADEHSSAETARFVIQHDEDAVFSAGIIDSGEQVLLGAHPNGMVVAVFFDVQGLYRRVEFQSPAAVGGILSEEALRIPSRLTWERITSWARELAFAPHVISVQQFMLVEEGVGISLLPDFMRKHLDASLLSGDSHSNHIVMQDIRQFVQQQRFVLLWCGKEFWMSSDGRITDS